ncbi:MAG: 6-phosphofructokinase [Bacteroidota bacterium]
MKKIAVFTSGGDAPGMNACVRAVVRTATFHGLEAVGIMRGFQGMIEGDFRNFQSRDMSNIIQRGGTILKSSRSKDFRTAEGRKKAFENLQSEGIEGVVAIGGDGTFTGAKVFGDEFDIPFVGVPGTIDNDIFGTDFTLGFDTAVNTALDAIDKIRDTADSHHRAFFVEVMGRNSGYIALQTGISGGAEMVIVPDTDPQEVVKSLTAALARGKTSMIIVVAEGDTEGRAKRFVEAIKPHLPTFDLRITILGHIQRGGSPTANDRLLGSRLGIAAVEALMSGKRNIMVGTLNGEVSEVPFSDAISKAKPLRKELLNAVPVLSI